MSQFFKCITSQSFDVKVGQMGSWIAANTVLCLGMYKLTKLPLSETELFLEYCWCLRLPCSWC